MIAFGLGVGAHSLITNCFAREKNVRFLIVIDRNTNNVTQIIFFDRHVHRETQWKRKTKHSIITILRGFIGTIEIDISLNIACDATQRT